MGRAVTNRSVSRKIPGRAAPRVTVLMLTCSRPQFISRAIQSVVDQTFQEWELIVVHDGPNEETAEVMGEWLTQDLRIRYFRRYQAGNIANACNYGLSLARGVYVAILDDDDSWASETKLAKQVAFLDDHPDYVACGGGSMVVDQNGNEMMSYLKPEQDLDIKQWALCANPMVHSATMFRRDVGERIGFYDETLSGFQDWDLWLRLGQIGKLYNFPEVFINYTLWSGGGSFQQQRRNAQSAVRIVWRNRGRYTGFACAFPLVVLHYLYAHLPSAVRDASFSFLSRLKKALFSAGTQSVTPQPPERKLSTHSGRSSRIVPE